MKIAALILSTIFCASSLGQEFTVADLESAFVKNGYEQAAELQREDNANRDEKIAELQSDIELAGKLSKYNRNFDGPTRLNGLGELATDGDVVEAIAFPNAKAKRDFIAEAKAAIEELEKGKDRLPKWRVPSMPFAKQEMNTIGHLKAKFKVFQNLGDGSFLAKHEMEELRNLPLVLISGLPGAKDLADDSVVALDRVVMCIRVHQYESTSGVRTVNVLDMCEPAKIQAIIEKSIPKEDLLPRPETSKPAELRTWSDDSGKFSVTARFKAMNAGKAVLVKEDGMEIQVPLSKLSKGDQDWIRANTKP